MLKLIKPAGRKNYVIRGTIAGKRIHKSTGTDQRKLAEAQRRQLETQLIERASLGTAATLTFAEAALTYIESGGEARYLEKILRHFGPHKLLREINNDEINKAARVLYPQAAQNTIQRQLITPISAVYSMAVKDDLAPVRQFRRRGKPNPRIHWLTPEEAERVIEAAGEIAPHILRPLAIMLGGGARAAEALRVTAATFYRSTGEAFIEETKNGEPRMIRFPRRALKLIEAGELPEYGPICLTPKGVPYVIREHCGGQMKGAFDRLSEAAELSFHLTPHILRHTWATWYHAQTHDFGALLDLGGWKRADVANVYRKIAPEDLGDRLHATGWDFTRADFRKARDTSRGGVTRLARGS